MADFCVQCAEEHGFPTDDFSHFKKLPPLEPGYFYDVICEGCGFIQVDADGNCVTEDCLMKGHKKE